MSNYDIHSYECDPSFYGCAEPDEIFHACDEAFYSPPLNWDSLPTVPQYSDETYISADYTGSTNFHVEDQDNEEHMFSTSLDAEITHNEGDNTEDNTTPRTDTFNSEGSTQSYTYTPYDPLHSQVVEQLQTEMAQEEASSAIPIMLRHAHAQPPLAHPTVHMVARPRHRQQNVADWENDWHHLHGNGLPTVDDDTSYVTSGHVDTATHIHAKAPSPSLTNDSHNTEVYAVTNVTPAYDDNA
ncbi:hypothetical protein K439DRAFT_1625330 [Ramaria rubella]|nr:hypothetical protein K439DRAFT_1625330 [Ramaria rubella]